MFPTMGGRSNFLKRYGFEIVRLVSFTCVASYGQMSSRVVQGRWRTVWGTLAAIFPLEVVGFLEFSESARE